MHCVFSAAAERDLEEIGDCIARENLRRAISFIAEIRERCFQILTYPFAAHLREEFGEGIRKWGMAEWADKEKSARRLNVLRLARAQAEMGEQERDCSHGHGL